MRLQTLQVGGGAAPVILAETPWHDDASATGGDYRERLKQYLGGFFEADETTMSPKAELLGGSTNPVPDTVRLVDDAGQVVASYDFKELERDTGLRIVMPSQEDLASR